MNINKQLQAALRSEESASKAKSDFITVMNHEIRTPMNGIIGFSELAINDKAMPYNAKEYFEKIKMSAEGLLGIIDALVDIPKIEAGEAKFNKTSFNITETLNLCQAIATLKAAEKNISVKLNIEPFVARNLVGDTSKLRCVLLDILSNAVEFTVEGSVALNVYVEDTDADSLNIRFEVKYGKPGSDLEMAKKMIRLMGGRLTEENTHGVGSIYGFTLMFKASGGISAVEPKESGVQGVFKGDALVCEDNEINQIVICEHLKRLGIKAEVAPNGKAGIELAKARILNGAPFDIIFMDIHMPVMDGLQAAEALGAAGNNAPVIALTASVKAEELKNYKKHGMSSHLGKPFKSQELQDCLFKYLAPNVKEDCSCPQPRLLDHEAGIGQYDGDREVYESILKKFIKNNKNVMAGFKDALNGRDIKLAHRIAHSLRGAGGVIGAARLADAAYNAERALADGEIDLAYGFIGALEKELTGVFNEIREITAEKDDKKFEPKTLDKEKTIKLIDELIPLLENGNSKSMEYLDGIKDIYRSVADDYKLLITQIENYDFELASDTIKKIKKFI